MDSFHSKYGPRALVTGAAAGIGAAFARSLAARGLGLTLVDRDGPSLASLADSLTRRGADVRLVEADLLDAEGVAQVSDLLGSSEVGLFVSNAGSSDVGPFVELPLALHQRTLSLNCGTSLSLIHRAASAMTERARGGIILLSSNSGVIHSPFVAHYAATKAYALALGEAIHEELREKGVDVLVSVPGLTRTPGLHASGFDERAARGLVIDPERVAEGSLDRLGKSARFVPNPNDLLGAWFMAALPRRAGLAINAWTMRRLFPKLSHPKKG